MSGPSGDLGALKAAALSLRPRVRTAKPLPRLLFLTDPVRTPDPEAVIARLDPDVAVIFRAFGAADAVEQGRRLAAIAKARGLILLVGADEALAEAIGADGLHLPEWAVSALTDLRARRPDWIITAAAHSLDACLNASAADAVLVSPVFASNSPSAGTPLGVEGFSRIVAASSAPVYALGGVTGATAGLLTGSGAAGFAGIEGFLT
jgi:thiamine-phosphate pyrophosphorylase